MRASLWVMVMRNTDSHAHVVVKHARLPSCRLRTQSLLKYRCLHWGLIALYCSGHYESTYAEHHSPHCHKAMMSFLTYGGATAEPALPVLHSWFHGTISSTSSTVPGSRTGTPGAYCWGSIHLNLLGEGQYDLTSCPAWPASIMMPCPARLAHAHMWLWHQSIAAGAVQCLPKVMA